MTKHLQQHGFASTDDHDFTGFIVGELLTTVTGPVPASSGITASSVSAAVAATHAALTLAAGVTSQAASLLGQQLTLVVATPATAGIMSAADKTKLDGIEAGATADQLASEVSFTPTATISATDVQAAVAEVDLEHVAKAAVPVNDNLYSMDANGDGKDSGVGASTGDGAINKAAVVAPTLVASDWAIEDLGVVGGVNRYDFVFEASGGKRMARLAPHTIRTTVANDLNINDSIVLINLAGTYDLPAPTAQKLLRLKRISGGVGAGNYVTLNTPGAETIDGAATYILASQYEAVDLVSDGTDWFTL